AGVGDVVGRRVEELLRGAESGRSDVNAKERRAHGSCLPINICWGRRVAIYARDAVRSDLADAHEQSHECRIRGPGLLDQQGIATTACTESLAERGDTDGAKEGTFL